MGIAISLRGKAGKLTFKLANRGLYHFLRNRSPDNKIYISGSPYT